MTYNTKTQSGLHTQHIDVSTTKRLYFIPASESPTTFVITPGKVGNVNYGISGVQDENGKNYTYGAAAASITASNATPGCKITVSSDSMDKIRSATMVVTVKDDASQIIVRNNGNGYYRSYTGTDFTNNKLNIAYDPKTENSWQVYRADSKKPFMAKLNGNKQNHVYSSFNMNGTYTFIPSFSFNTSGDGNQNLTITSDIPAMDIPVKFEFAQTTGNEQDPNRLTDMIEKVYVNGKELTDKSWLKEGFTVPNGASMYLGIKQQTYGVWVYDEVFFNGKKLTSPGTYVYVMAEDPSEVQTYRITGMLNSPWRYTLNFSDYNNARVRVNGNSIDLTSNTYNGTAGYVAPSIKPMGKNNTKVYSVTVDGKTVDLDENGCYTPKAMDEVITITPQAYKREMDLQINADFGNYSGLYLWLDPNGQVETRVDLVKGWQTIKVNPEDLPFDTGVSGCSIYVNGKLLTEKDEYGLFTELKNVKSTDKINIYTYRPSLCSVTHKEFPDGVSATIYHDGEKIDGPGTYSVLPGTEIKYVPTAKSGLVIETGDGDIINPAADGSFTITASSGKTTYSLHPTNPKVTVNCASNWGSFTMQNMANGVKKKLTSSATEYIFPYTGVSNEKFSLKLYDADEKYMVKSVTSVPAGATFDANTMTVSNLSDGMKLTLTVQEYEKPYYYNITVNSSGQNIPIFVNYTTPDGMEAVRLEEGKNYKQLSAANFPVIIGACMYMYGDIAEVPIQSDWALAADGQKKTMGSYYNDGYITIDTPKAIEGMAYYASNTKKLNFISQGYSGDKINVSFDLQEPENISLQNFNPRDYIYNHNFCLGSSIRIIPDSQYGYGAFDVYMFAASNYDSGDKDNWTKIEPEADGIYNIPTTDLPYDGSGMDAYLVCVELKYVDLNFDCDISGTFTVTSCDIKEYALPGSGCLIPIGNDIQITFNSSDYTLLGFSDKKTGRTLEYDKETGILKGFSDLCRASEDDTVTLEPYLQKIERDKKMTVFIDNSTYTSKKLTLATGNTYSSLTNGTVIEYGDADLPFTLDCFFRKSAMSTVSYAHYYLNGAYGGQTANVGKGIQISPDEEGVLRIMLTKSTKKVDYSIEDNIKVDVTHDGLPYTSTSGDAKDVPNGTIIKISPAADNEVQDFVITRNGTVLTDAQLANGFAVSNATETIRVYVPRNTITFATQGDLNLSDLAVSDDEGNNYLLSADNNSVTVLGKVESLKVLDTREDYFISEVTSDPASIKFDTNTGELTNLTTGTVTIASKKLERTKEVDIYVDGNELNGAQLTLGNGKTISTDESLNQGNQKIQFSDEDLPIIFKLPDTYVDESGNKITDPNKLPAVYVNGQKLEYSEENNGYVFPVDAFNDPKNPPVIKIYPATPDPVEISYLVEPGITFKAIADGEEDKAVSTADAVTLLPGTVVSLTATADKSGEEIYLEINGETIHEGTTINYDFTVGNEDQILQIKRKKVLVTVNNEDSWRSVRVNGAGFSYPMYDAKSELEFPVGTTELTMRSTSDSERVTAVKNAKTGAALNFDAVTGIVTGISDEMSLNIEMGPMTREKEVLVYFEEGKDIPTTSFIIAEDKAVEKTLSLKGGYQTVVYDNSDLPFAVKSAEPMSVYLNNALISYNSADAAYDVPAELPENPVVKVYTKEQPEVKVKYESEAGGYFDMVVTHDRVNVIDHTAAEGHIALPGTEIRFTVEYNEAGKQLLAARKAAGKQVSETTEVSVNGTVLEPDEDGAYSYKVSADHAATGLSFLVKRPDFIDEESGYVLSFDRKTLISVDPDKEGEFTVPDGVTTIGEGAFKGCDKLTTVVIPKSVTEVEENAFSGNTNLKQVVYPEELEEELGSQIDGLDLPTPPVKVGYTTDEVSIDENGVITGRNIDPETGNYVEGKTLVYVPDEAIDENGTYKIPDDITEIGKGAFEGNENLKNIEIPETVTSIGNGAFSGCKNLTDVDLTEGLKEIGEGAFTGSGITDINVPNSVKEIGEGAFKNCENLEKVIIGGGVDSIDPDVFEGSDNIKEAIYPDDLKDTLSEKLPDGIKQVPYTADEIEVDEETGVITGKSTKGEGEDAKESKSLVFVPDEAIDENGTYKIPDDIDEIDNGAFTGNEKLTNLEIPETVTSIGNGAFTGCKNLEELDIPDTVTDLGDGVLEGCENISKVTIPDGVESIGPDEFKGCTNLKEVTLPETVTEIGEGAFEGCSNLETINIPETVTEIGENAFKGCEKLTEVTLPDNIESIGKGAFEGCSNLTDVNIPDNVKEIGEGAFKGCESLTTIAIPPTVDNIGDGAFDGCTNLDKFVYPDKFKDQIGEGVGIGYPADEAKVDENGVIYTPDAVYFVPSDAKAATIPETATMIAPKAFKNCTEIENVTVPNQVDEIAAETFSGCSSLKTITLGSSIASIGAGAFKGCSSLHEINIHSNVKNIGANAFDGCDLTQIHIGAGITTIGDDAFAGNNNIDEIAITAQTPPALGSNAFGGNTTAKLFVQGAGAVTAYGSAAGWNVYTPQVMVEATSVNSTDKTSYEMNRGDNVQLNASVLPSDAKLGAIFWEVSDPSMATVSNTGLVTLIEPTTASRKAAGDKTLTVTARTMYANGPTHTVTIKDVTTGVDMVFEDGEASSIEELLSKGAIYTLGGLKVNADTKSLEPGIYIIKIDGKTRKITVK
ncbi:MAG: leucine-rich repeat protein [Bacteroides sp.]|nr:leucine-rich repeat protein [Bacteroides sp.]